MEIFKLFIIIISVCCFCFILFQLWFFVENREYIYLFNQRYKNLEYVSSPNMFFIDKNVFDPNDTQTDPNKKFRCAQENGITYALSEDGFMSGNSSQITLTWTNETDCVNTLFKTNNIVLYDPCAISQVSNNCLLLNRLMS